MPAKTPINLRFWNKARIAGRDDCWEWLRSKDSGGYGMVGVSGKNVKAHRVSWMLTHGEIPEGKCILHKCDNRLCINPRHLFVGTQQENIRDMVSKKRQHHPVGERNPKAKLTECDVRKIIQMKSTGMTNIRIALHFGVSESMIEFVIKRKCWKHVSLV